MLQLLRKLFIVALTIEDLSLFVSLDISSLILPILDIIKGAFELYGIVYTSAITNHLVYESDN